MQAGNWWDWKKKKNHNTHTHTKTKKNFTNDFELRSLVTQFNYNISSWCQRGVKMECNDSLADRFGAISSLKMSPYVTKNIIAFE